MTPERWRLNATYPAPPGGDYPAPSGGSYTLSSSLDLTRRQLLAQILTALESGAVALHVEREPGGGQEEREARLAAGEGPE